MSRIGKKPIEIPAGVTIKVEDSVLIVSGAKGTLKQVIHSLVKVEQKDNQLLVIPTKTEKEDKRVNAFWGLYRSLIQNMVVGVSIGFEKKLEMRGIGFKAEMKGTTLVLHVGFSHPVEFFVPIGITASVTKNVITLQGIDKQLVGETAAVIRKIRKPEPYKGKGIRYFGEEIKLKEGKSAGKASS
ncbi:MAG: 50S ribosomal protein L6 [Candidatus Falkowbacteria bacterium]